jgi:hypothetical protein
MDATHQLHLEPASTLKAMLLPGRVEVVLYYFAVIACCVHHT